MTKPTRREARATIIGRAKDEGILPSHVTTETEGWDREIAIVGAALYLGDVIETNIARHATATGGAR